MSLTLFRFTLKCSFWVLFWTLYGIAFWGAGVWLYVCSGSGFDNPYSACNDPVKTPFGLAIALSGIWIVGAVIGSILGEAISPLIEKTTLKESLYYWAIFWAVFWTISLAIFFSLLYIPLFILWLCILPPFYLLFGATGGALGGGVKKLIIRIIS